jgi:hypothetical protein
MFGAAWGDIPLRKTPAGTTVPNPGTQQQELFNITFPAPYNVFEFVVTCMACHGGSVDQNAAHGGNWAGTAMASSARDPVFRANHLIINNAVKPIQDGVGNMCFRCHSPNGWYSGRFDPKLAGQSDASNMYHSILLSTDDEGISCEVCHRAIGNVIMKRSDLDANDPVWTMMAGIDDWPHTGNPFPEGPVAGNPYGDTTLQLNDGMTYGGKYAGSVNIHFSDLPIGGTNYTGQTYGVYPLDWYDAALAGQPVLNPDGTYSIHFEEPIGPPLDPVTGKPNYMEQGISLEHPTYKGNHLRTPEFCATCHELPIPVLNHGMPEQRTYTEWKYSNFGRAFAADPNSGTRCQDCHMPTLKHEYSDIVKQTLNPDPAVSGWFPYAKDRNLNLDPMTGRRGTTFHKFGGGNLNLPDMMTNLYPEVDLEVIGAPTGNDTRIFPGMLSDRTTMWERTKRNSEISLRDAVSVQILNGPTYIGQGRYEVKVKVINNTGHRIPTGYPDGRRFWVNLRVYNNAGTLAYESGYYDQATAQLYNDSAKAGLTRATTAVIDKNFGNKVMIYEKRTGSDPDGDGNYAISVSLLNNKVVFDNRIPPAGFDYSQYSPSGVKFMTYLPGTVPDTVRPIEQAGRFVAGANYDIVTYRFTPPRGVTPAQVRAEIYWQTHTREFMEHLRDGDTTGPRPEGPPSVFQLNYPLVPTYLSDVINLAGITDPYKAASLNDNWGGIAYASWLLTGQGTPHLVCAADTRGAAPGIPGLPSVNQVPDQFGLPDPCTLLVSWPSVASAEGYKLWVRYGTDTSTPANIETDLTATASWDMLKVLPASQTSYRHEALNESKTYQYRVQAFNGKGESAFSPVAAGSTPVGIPTTPQNLKVVTTNNTPQVNLAWNDINTTEQGFIIERQEAPPTQDFLPVAQIPTPDPNAFTVTWTDTAATGLQSGKSYNYRVRAYNASGASTPGIPVMAIVP